MCIARCAKRLFPLCLSCIFPFADLFTGVSWKIFVFACIRNFASTNILSSLCLAFAARYAIFFALPSASFWFSRKLHCKARKLDIVSEIKVLSLKIVNIKTYSCNELCHVYDSFLGESPQSTPAGKTNALNVWIDASIVSVLHWSHPYTTTSDHQCSRRFASVSVFVLTKWIFQISER